MKVLGPDDFIAGFGKYSDANAATLFVGAGLSQPAGYPGWSDLLLPMRNELGIAAMSDLPQLAQFYVDNVSDGRDRLDAHIAELFAAIAPSDLTVVHLLLAELPVVEFWTTNYDPLLEQAIPDAHVFAHDQELAREIEPANRRVYKMHGSLPGGPLVITRDDYERYPLTHPRFWALLQASFLTKTFLFLGVGFADPNLELVFRLVRLQAADIPRQHFAIMRRPDPLDGAESALAAQHLFELRVGEMQRVGIEVVVVEDYGQIGELLGRLVARCRPPQVMVSGSAPGPVERSSSSGAYPTGAVPDELLTMAATIGEKLAGTRASVVAAGEVGATVGYQLLRALLGGDAYDSGRLTLLRRRRDEGLTPPSLRLGRVEFTGTDPTDLRSSALSEVRALLVLGGGPGTRSEVDQALEIGLGVVPVGVTGGAAAEVWEMLRNDPGFRLGGRAVPVEDFDLLMYGDLSSASAAAVRLVLQALFLE